MTIEAEIQVKEKLTYKERYSKWMNKNKLKNGVLMILGGSLEMILLWKEYPDIISISIHKVLCGLYLVAEDKMLVESYKESSVILTGSDEKI